MLHPNMGSPRDAATLGEIGSAFPATQGLPQQAIFLIAFLCSPSMGGKVQYPPPPVVQPGDLIIVANIIKICFPLYVFGVNSLQYKPQGLINDQKKYLFARLYRLSSNNSTKFHTFHLLLLLPWKSCIVVSNTLN